MALTQELTAFLDRCQLPQADRGLIKRVIKELKRLEAEQAKYDEFEKAAFEKVFPGVKKNGKRRSL